MINLKKAILYCSLITLFVSCGKEDYNNCYDSRCLKNEICVDGECVDYQPEKLPDLIDQPIPSKILLSNMVLTRYPAFKSPNEPWDNGSAPDLYIRLTQSATILREFTIANAPSAPISIPLSTPLEVANINRQIVINVFEDDGNQTDEHMGGAFKYLYSTNNRYPDKLTLDIGGSVGFTFDMNYEF